MAGAIAGGTYAFVSAHGARYAAAQIAASGSGNAIWAPAALGEGIFGGAVAGAVLVGATGLVVGIAVGAVIYEMTDDDRHSVLESEMSRAAQECAQSR